ncbi:MAG TPA: hypothetical protein K8V90_08395 [Romboutsia timonensis]|uniref:Uncharacterized protein n=1 Tax=Romboutsia timonensis TaxID=1776391 RepID=A0A921T022_9FIRM|nr:hypothetical protein [Romboutsia timonensis]
MNKQQLLNTIEAIRNDERNWNTLKLREIEEGIITREQYMEMREISEQRTIAQIARIEDEIRNLRG